MCTLELQCNQGQQGGAVQIDQEGRQLCSQLQDNHKLESNAALYKNYINSAKNDIRTHKDDCRIPQTEPNLQRIEMILDQNLWIGVLRSIQIVTVKENQQIL